MTDFPPTHPGEVLREDFLKPLGMSQYALAKAIGVPRIRISNIVNGKRAKELTRHHKGDCKIFKAPIGSGGIIGQAVVTGGYLDRDRPDSRQLFRAFISYNP